MGYPPSLLNCAAYCQLVLVSTLGIRAQAIVPLSYSCAVTDTCAQLSNASCVRVMLARSCRSKNKDELSGAQAEYMDQIKAAVKKVCHPGRMHYWR